MSDDFDQLGGDHAAEFMALFFRLFRLARMHDLDNDASRRALERGVEALDSYLGGDVRFLSMLFAGETVYVNGQPLKAERVAYDNALTVGQLLADMGFNEFTVRRGVTAGDLYGLLRAIAANQVPVSLPKTLRLRDIDPRQIIGEDEEEASIGEQVTATYAAAVVLVKRFNEGVAKDDFMLLRHIKRVSQRMVTLSEGGLLEWIALVRRPLPPTDTARIAVHAAIIGLLAGRALTRDMHALLRIAMACMKGDVGRPRVVGMYRDDSFHRGGIVPAPNESMRKRIPSSTGAILLQTGRASLPALKRTVVAYEAVHLSDGKLLGWPYANRLAPTVEGIVAAEAMRIAKGLAETSGPDELVRSIRENELGKVEGATLDLCWSILGITPRGTAVQMESGHFGVVLSAGPGFHDLEHPEIVLLLDESGSPVAPTRIYSGGEYGWVRQVVHKPDRSLMAAYEAYKRDVRDGYADAADISITQMPSDEDSVDQQSTLVFNPDAAGAAPEFLRAIWDD
jgi:hypothetical protein